MSKEKNAELSAEERKAEFLKMPSIIFYLLSFI